MARLDTAYAIYKEVIAHIAFFNLAFHTRWPNLICTHQPIKNAVIALSLSAWWKALLRPICIQLEYERSQTPGWSRGSQAPRVRVHVVAEDMEHFLLHHNHLLA